VHVENRPWIQCKIKILHRAHKNVLAAEGRRWLKHRCDILILNNARLYRFSANFFVRFFSVKHAFISLAYMVTCKVKH